MDLADYAAIFRRYWLHITAAVLLGALVAFGWSALQPRIYQANASGFVKSVETEGVSNAMAGDAYAKSRAKSYIDVARSRATAESVIQSLGIDTTPENLIKDIAVTVPSDTVVIQISAKGTSPEKSRDLADQWITSLADQINGLERNSNSSRLDGQPVVELVAVESAVLPTQPVSPRTLLNTFIGALVGLVIGLGYAIIRNQYDKRIRSAQLIEKKYNMPVIGTLPIADVLDDLHRIPVQEFDGSQDASKIKQLKRQVNSLSESFKELRTNLQFVDVDNPPRHIVITSSLANEGKSAVTANLAITLAESGQRVVVIDADLRKPTVEKTFNLVPGIGVTDVLAGRVEIEDALQPWGESGNLFVLAAGRTPPNPSELLGSQSMRTLIQELSYEAIVLLDAPPLLPVTDAAILTANADGAVLVVSAGKTTEDQLEKAISNIEKVKGKVLGVILNRIPPGRASAYEYSYYGGYYAEDADQQTETPDSSQITHESIPAEDNGQDETSVGVSGTINGTDNTDSTTESASSRSHGKRASRRLLP